MDRKNLIALIAGCLAVLLLICILLVGALDGIWPWDGVTAYGRLITSRTQATVGPKETTAPTEESTSPSAGNQQGAASGEQQEEVKPTVGEVGQKPVPPTLPTEGEDIKTEVGGVVIPPQGSTDGTESSTGSTETTEDNSSTGPTEEKADGTVDASQIPW